MPVEPPAPSFDALSLRLAGGTDPEAVAAIVLDEALPQLGARSGSLCLLDIAGRSLELVATHGYPGDVVDSWTVFPIDAELPASVAARSGETIVISSTAERDERFPSLAEGPLLPDESIACLPLRAPSGAIVGVLVAGFTNANAVDAAMLASLEALGAHAATAIERTSGRVQLTFIADASARLARSLDLAATLEAIESLAVPRLADAAALHLAEDIDAGAEGDAEQAELRRKAVPEAVEDVLAGAPWSLRAVDGGQELVVPLRLRSRLVGALWLRAEAGRTFSRSDRRLADELAARAAVAIDNARLFQSERRQREAAEVAEGRLRQLHHVMRDLARAVDADEVAAVLAHISFPGFEVRSRGIWLMSDDRTRLELVANEYTPRLPESMAVIPIGSDYPAALVARTGEPVVVGSVEEREARFASLSGYPHVASSFVVLPLVVDDVVLGVLSLGMADGLSADDLPFLVGVAEQVAQALGRARLYQRERTARERAVADRVRIQTLVAALQRSLLPPELPAIPGVELSARYLAGMAGLDVGGDFYDVFPVGRDWAVAVGDVCGKGPEAAALTAVVRSTIRSVAIDTHHPSQVLRRVNDALVHQALDDRFCTVAYGRAVFSADGLRLEIGRAGHPAPLVRRRSGTVEPIGANGPLLGVLREIRVWDETTTLGEGDAVVFYTDGVIEARRGEEQFGVDRLAATISASPAQSAEELAAAVEDAVRSYSGELADDTAILVVRVVERSL